MTGRKPMRRTMMKAKRSRSCRGRREQRGSQEAARADFHSVYHPVTEISTCGQSLHQPGSMPFDLKTAVARGEVRYSIKAFVAATCSAFFVLTVGKTSRFSLLPYTSPDTPI